MERTARTKSGKDSIEVILSGLAGAHEGGMLNRKLGTSRMLILE